MPDVLIATDADWVHEDVEAALGGAGRDIRRVRAGAAVRAAVAERAPDLAVLDLQIGNMGGIAACLDLRLEESAGRAPHVPVLLLLDRPADVNLARRSAADGWVVKPLEALSLRRAADSLLAGDTYFEGVQDTVVA